MLNNVGVASRLADSSKAIILPDAGTAGVTTRSGREYGTGRSGGFSSGSGLFGKSGGSYFDDAPMAVSLRSPVFIPTTSLRGRSKWQWSCLGQAC